MTTKTTKRSTSVTIDGVTIAWRDSRYMGSDHDDPTGDMDLRGEYRVEITVRGGEIDAIAHPIECARRLKCLAKYSEIICPVPGSQHMLRLDGLDSHGGPVWQVVVGDRLASAIPAGTMAHIDPSDYSQSGDTAMRTIAWMRAVGRATSSWDYDDMRHVLHTWDQRTLDVAALQFCREPAKAVTP